MSATSEPLLSVMIPAYNEAQTVGIILGHVLLRPEVGEVIAVDDGSSDGTGEVLERAARRDQRVRLLRHEKNQGKGAALRRAIPELRMPFALVQDADLEYDPRDYQALLRPVLEGRTDVVYGVRGFAGHSCAQTSGNGSTYKAPDSTSSRTLLHASYAWGTGSTRSLSVITLEGGMRARS